ncbi:hypothetical protein MAPG_07221 [Magnaporthiopsis poae ATCC 64411]|uniref:Prolyl 4-hydroxylase alpha subunit Fe(2+) 2OG dioxygenase domain-containing protein n=1 Tax=Magnaporthiopsis poae (strain ATCC 64411 / 73-15) TaxID=644358 RepID=A0A0C4E433_MAGP6|nr:hypothetical protein MAPG_07221 [Magnaporthiopsis poae ATCC 64411]
MRTSPKKLVRRRLIRHQGPPPQTPVDRIHGLNFFFGRRDMAPAHANRILWRVLNKGTPLPVSPLHPGRRYKASSSGPGSIFIPHSLSRCCRLLFRSHITVKRVHLTKTMSDSEMSDSERERQYALSDSISWELGRFIASKSSTFACGGSIPIETTDPTETPSKRHGKDDTLSTAPISIRWDSSQGNEAISVAKITFPIVGPDGEASLAKLAQDCQPASFGYKGKDVLDESYRKAAKMDRSAFSSDFCPYELGIIDTIAQVLLPNTREKVSTKGVRAELYKLNIYSSPSGFFKPHVDTPRSEAQFGSLVVSLPCQHEGGQLIVRHARHTTTFDWSASKARTDAVHWAAFYSDCEHEVKELTEGHRVTLTYNLYYAPGVGDLAKHAPAMEVETLPLYQKVHSALAEPDFMHDGGILGIYCTHAYAHSTEAGGKALPSVLKGADMAVYAVFRAHGLKVFIRPVHPPTRDDEDNEYYDSDSEFNTRAGIHLGELTLTELGGDDGSCQDDVWNEWPHDRLDVNWLTSPGPEELEEATFVHLTYGNQAGVDAVYMHAALLVEVPAASERRQVAERG